MNTIGTLLVILSAAGFATLAIFLKIAYAAGANVITVLAIRFAIASLLLWLTIKIRNIDAHLDRSTKIRLGLLGIFGYGLEAALFAASLNYLSASMSSMILYTYPAIVSIICFITGSEQFTLLKGVSLAVCFSGLFLILGISLEGLNLFGLALGLGAATIYSLYIIIGNKLAKSVDSFVVSAYICTATALAYITSGALTGGFVYAIAPQGWFSIAGIAVLGTYIAILSFFAGMQRIGAANASIVSTTEPLITVLLSILFLGETVALPQMAGGLLIIGGVIMLQKASAVSHPSTDTLHQAQ